jgi:hypothetical protein
LREREGVRVAVETEETNPGTRLEKRARVPARAERRVDEKASALRREKLDDLADENRRVWRLLKVFRLSSLFSCPVFRVPYPASRKRLGQLVVVLGREVLRRETAGERAAVGDD